MIISALAQLLEPDLPSPHSPVSVVSPILMEGGDVTLALVRAAGMMALMGASLLSPPTKKRGMSVVGIEER